MKLACLTTLATVARMNFSNAEGGVPMYELDGKKLRI